MIASMAISTTAAMMMGILLVRSQRVIAGERRPLFAGGGGATVVAAGLRVARARLMLLCPLVLRLLAKDDLWDGCGLILLGRRQRGKG